MILKMAILASSALPILGSIEPQDLALLAAFSADF
jgi:hypothetical protein